MRFEKLIVWGEFKASIVKINNRTPYQLLFNEHDNSFLYIHEALDKSGWQQDLTVYTIGIPLWVKPLTRVTLHQLEEEAAVLLGALYNQNMLLLYESVDSPVLTMNLEPNDTK